nr:glutaminase [Chroococcidiopsis sp. CCMEE 29]
METQDDRSLVIHQSEAVTSALQSVLNDLHLKYKPVRDGTLANYIPELAKVNPDLFSICIITVDGQVYEVGGYNHLFTLQSISKVFVYGMALEEHGRKLTPD